MASPGVRRAPKLLFNPFDPLLRADPYPAYRRLREADPVHRSPLGFWVLSRYADVVAMQRDARLGMLSPAVASAIERMRESGDDSPVTAVARRWLLLTDPDQHRRFRAVLGRLFAPRALEAARPAVAAVVGALLDELPAGGPVDLVRRLARPLPIRVMTSLLGLPREQLDDYASWSFAIGRVLESVVDLPTIQELSGAMIACEASLHAVLAERRRRPGDDLLSRLMEAEFEGQPVTDDEVVSYVSLMLGAAAETTANLIGNSLLALLQHPAQLQLLRDDPSLVPGAIEELLRFDSPAQLHGRWALEDVEVGGRTIPGGSKVILLIGAANRDPDQFPDPDALDVRRANVRFASFGTGAHYCLGAGFARLEAQVALPMVLDRYPRLGPIVEGPRWREEHVALRSLATLVIETDRFREDDGR